MFIGIIQPKEHKECLTMELTMIYLICNMAGLVSWSGVWKLNLKISFNLSLFIEVKEKYTLSINLTLSTPE